MRIHPPSPRERALAQADARMASAKLAFSRAALSCLRGSADAQEQVRGALAAVDQARAELARLADDDLDALDSAALAKLGRKP